MFRKFLAGLLALMMIFVSGAMAEDSADAVLQEQVARSGAGSLQAWLDGDLTGSIDGIGGWYVIALRKMGAEVDFGPARDALREKAAEDTQSVTKKERMALAAQAMGMDDEFIDGAVSAAADEETLMPLIFALHLMNNGAEGADRETIVQRLLGLQLEDGGWAVIGTAADVDCTAMALQALSPLRGTDENVDAAIDRGLSALSSIQLENGGFTGMGMESAESCAQVILALSSLGIDARTDARFVKSGGSAADAMARFRIEGEGYSHDAGGSVNDTATVQCLSALVSMEHSGTWYVFEGEVNESGFRLSAKGWMLAAILALLLIWWLIALARGKRNARSYLFPVIVCAVLAAIVWNVDIRNPEEYYTAESDAERTVPTVISIRCDAVAGENEYASADGVILAETEIMIAEGGTAFDQLLEATRSNRIQMEYDGTVAGAYVRGIGYLYEYDFGNLSGWMYKVNGVFADVGCSQYTLREGDHVEWVYTKNLGKDE